MAKNDGPTLVSVLKGALNAIPDRWRAKLGVTRTVIQKDPAVAPDALSSSVVGSAALQERTDERQVIKEEIGDPSGVTLTEKYLTEDGTIATRTRSLISSSSPVPSHLTDDVRQDNLGVGYIEASIAESSSFAEREGQFYDEQEDMIIPFTEQIVGAGTAIGDARTEVTPLSDVKFRKRVLQPDPDVIEAEVFTFESTTDLQFPDVLTGIEVVYNSASGAGSSSIPISDIEAAAVGSSGSVSIDPRAQAQGSASIIPELIPTIRTIWAQNVRVKHVVCFMANPVSDVSVLIKLSAILGASVNPWPVFKPEPLTFILNGQQASISASAQSHARLSWSGDSKSGERVTGKGQSIEVSTAVRVVRIPPTIHAAFNLTGPTSKKVQASATANASTIDIVGSGTAAGVIRAKTNVSAPEPIDVEGSVTPPSVSATSITSIPTSGLYLYRVNAEKWKYGYATVHAMVIDFSVFA